MPTIHTRTDSAPPYSREVRINPDIAAQSITPAANDKIISLNLCESFLKAKPIPEPITVAPPTPRAVNNTMFIKNLLI